MSDDTKVKIGENEFTTLAELAGLNMDDVKEQRGFVFPKGDFVWEISTDPENLPRLGVIGEGDNASAAIIYPCKCLDVVRVNDNEFTGNEADLIGKIHRETFFLNRDIEVALGYNKAFLKDIGAPYVSGLAALIAASSGTRFQAPITHTKNKNDADKVYVNLNRMKLKPVAAGATSDLKVA